MKTCVAALIFSLLCLSEAQLQTAGECNGTKIRALNIVFFCAGDTEPSQENCKPVLEVTELGAKLENAQEQFQDAGLEAVTGAAVISPPVHANFILTQRTDIPDAEKYYLSKGIFTAPAKGDYLFSFSGQRMPTIDAGGSQSDAATKDLILALEEGEQVHMSLPAVRFHLHLHFHIHIHVHVHVKVWWR